MFLKNEDTFVKSLKNIPYLFDFHRQRIQKIKLLQEIIERDWKLK